MRNTPGNPTTTSALRSSWPSRSPHAHITPDMANGRRIPSWMRRPSCCPVLSSRGVFPQDRTLYFVAPSGCRLGTAQVMP